MTDFESSSVWISVSEDLKHLLVAGNCLIFNEPDGGIRVHPLSRYVGLPLGLTVLHPLILFAGITL